MIILFIVVTVILLAIVFMAGFWAGKHCERAHESANRQVFIAEMEKALNKEKTG
jgi:ABC-type transporter Mla maintaining outer membrane lipid asymmetry permease subunit MlaE